MSAPTRILAITACPTGIAHTFMAAEKLEAAAEELGYSIRVETHGSIGVEGGFTDDEIAHADAVVIAARDKRADIAGHIVDENLEQRNVDPFCSTGGFKSYCQAGNQARTRRRSVTDCLRIFSACERTSSRQMPTGNGNQYTAQLGDRT